jgi:hypothetical protein
VTGVQTCALPIYEPQMGLDTKTYWLTDRQSQCDFDFDFDFEGDAETEERQMQRQFSSDWAVD